jgi:hypothetical protein
VISEACERVGPHYWIGFTVRDKERVQFRAIAFEQATNQKQAIDKASRAAQTYATAHKQHGEPQIARA